MFDFFASYGVVVAAFFSAVATFFAAVATWRGPSMAARLAERLRREADASHEIRRQKLYVFTTLMQERGSFPSDPSVKALNLIDIVFNDSEKVRDSWAALYMSFDNNKPVPSHVRDERMRELLKEMAIDLGLASSLRLDDLDRIYYPNILAEEDELRVLERRVAKRRLAAELEPSANVATQVANLFPPRPTPEE